MRRLLTDPCLIEAKEHAAFEFEELSTLMIEDKQNRTFYK